MGDTQDLSHNAAAVEIPENKVCLCCGYTHNQADATRCEICGKELIDRNILYDLNISHNKSGKFPQSRRFLSKLCNQYLSFSTTVQKNIKPNTTKLLGLAIVGLGIALWVNYLIGVFSISKESDWASPSGLFSYGGAPFYAPLVSHGLNTAIEAKNPDFQLRYAEPLNQDFSYSNGIKMLIDGELSFAFNGRPLTVQQLTPALRDEV